MLNFLDILSRPEKSAREPWRSIIQISSCAESRFSFLSAKIDDVIMIFFEPYSPDSNPFYQPGIAIGRLCEKCDGKCVICDSYVRCTLL